MNSTITTKRASRWLRVFLPAILILVWLAAGSLGGPLFGRISEVSSNDPTAYLPTSAQATQVQKQLTDFLGSDSIPAIVVAAADEPLTDASIGAIQHVVADLPKQVTDVLATSPAIPSEDGRAVQIFVQLNAGGEIADDVAALDDYLAQSLPESLTVYVTGPAGFTADLAAGFSGIDGVLLLVALAAVLVILLVVYRSPLLPVAVLLTSVFALCAALGTVWLLAREGVILLSGQTQGILFILVIGAATDYGLFYVARFREELRRHAGKFEATKAAIRGSFEPILASGGTVIAGLLCLLLSDLQSNRDLGPVTAIGIVFAMLAAFTLLPALLYAFGRAAYWPRVPRFSNESDGRELTAKGSMPAEGGVPAEEGLSAEGGVPAKGMWSALPRVVSRKPRTLWIGTTVVLAIACVGVLQLNASGVAQSELVLGQSDARDGQSFLAEHFPGGSGNPAYIIADEAQLDQVGTALLGNPGVAAVSVSAKDAPSGTLQYTSGGLVSPDDQPAAQPTVVDGKVLIQATLTDTFDSANAENTIRELREQLGESALIGGTTATAIDSNDASIRDRNLIIPVILSVIFVILSLLLRSLVAPLLLVATTVLSFGATLGIAALLFNHVFDFPGADPAVPLFSFVFLVALGIDYNIFLMTRVREETLRHGTHLGISRGLAITGGVITSAGLVLAATFAALAVIPILFLIQIAFIVAFGVLLDTFLVRTVLVPALGYDIGRTIWWPSRLARGKE